MHNHTVVIYIQYKFHEIPSFGYLVMAEDGKTEGRTDKWMDKPKQYTPSTFSKLGAQKLISNTETHVS